MLEESGTVVKTEGEWAWVETAPRSACSHCGTGSCSTSVVAKLFGTRRNLFRIHNSLNTSAGEQVLIGIPDQVLVTASVRAYLFPLLAMVAGVAVAEWLGAGDIGQIGIAVLGLLGGLLAMGRISRTASTSQRLAPRLVSKLESPTPYIKLNELTRSTP